MHSRFFFYLESQSFLPYSMFHSTAFRSPKRKPPPKSEQAAIFAKELCKLCRKRAGERKKKVERERERERGQIEFLNAFAFYETTTRHSKSVANDLLKTKQTLCESITRRKRETARPERALSLGAWLVEGQWGDSSSKCRRTLFSDGKSAHKKHNQTNG